MDLEFDWDPNKASANEEKHDITIDDAMKLWYDPYRTDIDDDRFDYGENRRISTGQISDQRFVTVVYTRRAEKIRIISARKANRNERREYRQGKAQG